MKTIISILFLMLSIAGMSKSISETDAEYCVIKKDTAKKNDNEADSLINLVVTNKSIIKSDEIVKLGEFTKFGFKNLFYKFHYNSTLPYASQVNPNAELYMKDYLERHSKSLIKMKSWGTPYFNLIDNIFIQYGLPTELKYLAVIESSLKTETTSWVGAAGPWQFMPETARNFGLLVNRDIDERRDYLKSTHAAAKFLLKLYQEFHDWLLVIAAYNGGTGRVYDAIRMSNSIDFWKLQYYLPTESKNHVKKFIATHYIMEGTGTNTPSGYSSIKSDINPNEKLSSETITGKFIGSVIAKNLSMDTKEFNKYNPRFDDSIAEMGKYDLRLPEEKMKLFLEMKSMILNESVELLLNSN